MTPAEQIADLKSRSTPFRNVAVTQASIGYVVTGNTRYIDKDSGATNLEDNQQATASNADNAAALAGVFLTSGTFLPA